MKINVEIDDGYLVIITRTYEDANGDKVTDEVTIVFTDDGSAPEIRHEKD